ncbi:MAG: hypothetical protein RSA10_01840, partial [Bacilli bacterium]
MKKINDFLIYITVAIGVFFLIKAVGDNNASRILVSLSIIPIMFFPRIARSLFHVHLPQKIEFVYLMFVVFAQLIGSVFNVYNMIWWYDSFTHLISGSLTAVLALMVMVWMNSYTKKNIIFNILFMFAFSLMAAGIWEIFEFTSDCLLNGDTQNVLTTGVTDTMIDIIYATVGTLIVCITYYIEEKRYS